MRRRTSAPVARGGIIVLPGASSAHLAAPPATERRVRPAQPVTRIGDPAHGVTAVPDRALFETLARRDDVPGAAGVLEMKFLMTDVDTDHPRLFFMNTNTYSYHFDFATQAVGLQTDLHRFNAETYFTDQRRNLAGQVLAHDHFIAADGTTGLYALEF